jgi:hypothetical protein
MMLASDGHNVIGRRHDYVTSLSHKMSLFPPDKMLIRQIRRSILISCLIRIAELMRQATRLKRLLV